MHDLQIAVVALTLAAELSIAFFGASRGLLGQKTPPFRLNLS